MKRWRKRKVGEGVGMEVVRREKGRVRRGWRIERVKRKNEEGGERSAQIGLSGFSRGRLGEIFFLFFFFSQRWAFASKGNPPGRAIFKFRSAFFARLTGHQNQNFACAPGRAALPVWPGENYVTFFPSNFFALFWNGYALGRANSPSRPGGFSPRIFSSKLRHVIRFASCTH